MADTTYGFHFSDDGGRTFRQMRTGASESSMAEHVERVRRSTPEARQVPSCDGVKLVATGGEHDGCVWYWPTEQ